MNLINVINSLQDINTKVNLVYSNSTWKDKSNGIIADLGSHLLDTFIFWFGKKGHSRLR